jgi:hypothetical protein
MDVPENYEKFVGGFIQFGEAAVIYSVASNLQGRSLEKHKQSGGLFFSQFRAVGIAFLSLPIIIAVFIVANFVSNMLSALIK